LVQTHIYAKKNNFASSFYVIFKKKYIQCVKKESSTLHKILPDINKILNKSDYYANNFVIRVNFFSEENYE